MFHVGQKVHCTVNGGGTIEEVDAGIFYSVKVRLNAGDFDFYTEDGRLWLGKDVVLTAVEEPSANMYLSQDSMSKIIELISEGWEVSIHWGDHTTWTDVPSPSWEVDFTRRMEDGRYDNHESGYSASINEAVELAFNNIRNGVKLKRCSQ